MARKPGKVYLVGAGPGDPGLFTLRGKEVLSKADVVIYDRLANPRLLDLALRDAEFIYVGKRMGNHAVSQEEINSLIVEKALQGKKVVRLKGGDPFIFGRGGEEAIFCSENQIPFEIVPGVSSAIAGPAYAGIPLTHREHTASVAIITGHRQFDSTEVDVDWEGLAKGVGTLVFLMGMKNLPFIVSRLIEGGRSPDTPAAAIQWGTTPIQRTVTGTLKNIEHKVKEAELTPPSVVVIGNVVSLKEKLDWFEKRPLLGKRILVTRTREQASHLVRLLEEKGAYPLEFPTISVSMTRDISGLDAAISRLSSFDWVVFTSVNAVRFFFKRLQEKGMDARVFISSKIAVVGSASAECLSEFFIKPDLVPERFQAEGLVDEFKKLEIQGKNILIPGARETREILPEELERLGAKVERVAIYETKEARVDPASLELLGREPVDVVTFTSSSTVKNFFKILPAPIREKLLKEARLACIGPVTAKTVRELGANVAILPGRSTIPALVKGIEEYFAASQDCHISAN